VVYRYAVEFDPLWCRNRWFLFYFAKDRGELKGTKQGQEDAYNYYVYSPPLCLV